MSKNALKTTKNHSLNSSSSRCDYVGNPIDNLDGCCPQNHRLLASESSLDLSTCQGCVVKVRDFVHTTREQSACNELRGLLRRHTDTKQDGSSFVSVCPLADTPQLNRYSITLFNCVRFVRFYILSLYLSEFFYKFQLRKICKILF